MTIAEVIEKLKQCKGEEEAKVFVRVYSRRYTVAEVTPFDVDHRGIWISLPETMHVVERKGKQ